MSDPVAAWHAEHEYFSRLLGLLHKQLDVFHGGERPNYELMLDIVGYLRDYSDVSHHPREDVAFAQRCRGAEEAIVAGLHALRVRAAARIGCHSADRTTWPRYSAGGLGGNRLLVRHGSAPGKWCGTGITKQRPP